MKFKVLVILLLSLVYVEANTPIKSVKEIDQANRGLAYLKKQEEQNKTTIKLKRYYLSKRMEKPSFLGSYDEVYKLYLLAFLQKGQPVWLEDDTMVLHTSSNIQYLKRLQDIYATKYKLNLGIHKNPQFKKTEYTLRAIESKRLARYIDRQSSIYLAKRDEQKKNKTSKKEPKKQKKIAIVAKPQDTTVRPAQIASKKEIGLVEKAIGGLREYKKQSAVKFGKYILYKNVESPSFFSSKEPIYNLYLTAIVNGGNPQWLADSRFVFHSSSNRRYLKKLQKNYKRKYNLALTLEKNSAYKKAKSKRMAIESDDIIAYLEAKLPQSYKQKRQEKLLAVEQKRAAKQQAQKEKEEAKRKKEEEKQRAQEEKRKKQEEAKAKLSSIIPAKIESKKEAKRVQKGLATLEEQISNEAKAVKLKKFFLARTVKKPSFFGSMDAVHNLYLTALLHNGTPAWLEDERLVLHTSSGYGALKRLKKFYKKRYHLDLTIYKNPTYKSKMLPLMNHDISDVIGYIEAKTPEAYRKKVQTEEKKKIEAKKAKHKAEKRRAQKQKRLEAQKAKQRQKAQAKREKELASQKKKAAQKRKEAQKKREKSLAQEKRAKQEKNKKEKQAQEKQAKEREAKAEAKQDALAEERAKIAAEKRRVEAEKKALLEEKRKIAQAKAALAAQKQRAQEQKAKQQAQKEAQELKRKKAQAEKQAAQAEKRRLAKQKKQQAQKAKATAKKKKEDDLTSELDSMLKETSEYKEKLERAESIKYY